VVLMPVAEPPHKQIERDPGADVRYELCRLAVEGDERLEVSRDEVERGGRSYTVDTLAAWHERAPSDELFLILGADQAQGLPRWREPERVLELAQPAIAERAPTTREQVLAAIDGLAGAERACFFSMPEIDLSSSMLRERVARGLPIRYLVPPAVADRIESEKLYRQGVTA
jgi:nicotinate-nucleotide adenylyltransferase